MTTVQLCQSYAELGAAIVPTMEVTLSDGGKVKRKANGSVAVLTLEDFSACVSIGGCADSITAPGSTKTRKLRGTVDVPPSDRAGELTVQLFEGAASELV